MTGLMFHSVLYKSMFVTPERLVVIRSLDFMMCRGMISLMPPPLSLVVLDHCSHLSVLLLKMLVSTATTMSAKNTSLCKASLTVARATKPPDAHIANVLPLNFCCCNPEKNVQHTQAHKSSHTLSGKDQLPNFKTLLRGRSNRLYVVGASRRWV